MSIEDVDYMKLNSIKENYTFLIDSKNRNQELYPEPNNYTINFDSPFKNVFGIEILDATIPKTMYNIDLNSNTLIIYINTTKEPINSYLNVAKGLIWDYNSNINIKNEIINYILADSLKEKKTFTKSEWESFNITNLNKDNYVKVINPLKWINTKIKNNSIKLFNPNFSYNILSNNIFNITQELFNSYNIYNLRSYNVIPYLDYSQKPYLRWYKVNNPLIDNSLGLIWESIGTKKPNSDNQIINELLSNNLINKNIFTPEEFELFNINNLQENSFIFSNNLYFKPVNNYNIGTKWKNIGDILPNNGEFIDNINLSNAIFNKYFTEINSDDIVFTNTELNELEFTFNIDINDYIGVYLGLKWINLGRSIPNNINNEIYNEDLKKILENNNNKNFITFTKQEIFNLNINNLSNNSYINATMYWIPSIFYFVPDGLWIHDSSNLFSNKLIEKHNLFGLEWEYISDIEPEYGKKIINDKLSNKLIEKTVFTKEEWIDFNINDINYDDYILSNNKYYIPKYITFTESEWNSLNISNNLNVENFIKIDNNTYFKIVPTNYSSPEILNYSPIDNLNISNINDYEYLLDNFFEKFTISLPIGNYTITKLILALNDEFNKINTYINSRVNNNNKFLNNNNQFDLLLQCTGKSIPADLTNIIKFLCSRKIILDMNNSTSNEILGFYSKVNSDNIYLNNFQKLNINDYNNYNKFYHSIESINENSNFNNVIIAPGIVYLIGTKYIILKCPEIEQHLYGSLSYSKNTLGLAKIKTSHWGLNESTNFLFKLKLREFHPIGKLDKITLRFENSDGTLYDFRGVNHDIIFAIHYYSAKQNKYFQNSIINPEYKMNFIDYRYLQEDQEKESDSDDDNNYSRINFDNYKKNELLYGGKKFNNGYETEFITNTHINNTNNTNNTNNNHNNHNNHNHNDIDNSDTYSNSDSDSDSNNEK